jgi:AcrB/AcrD/AcrF family protein
MPGLVSQAAMLQSEAVPNIPGLLSNVATLQREAVPTNLNQTNIQPVYDIYASVQDRDLGSVSDDISKIVAELQKELKPGNTIQVLGQIQSMNDSFRDLGIGLLFAAVFVYMLMVVNYQNFGDPFVVILALPATLCGIVTMLFITGTTLSVPSLMGGRRSLRLAELRDDNRDLAAKMRETHGLCEEHNDMATASLLEVWIDEAERRTWFLFEATNASEPG